MNEKQIAEIRARAEAATPGPWMVGNEMDEYLMPVVSTVSEDEWVAKIAAQDHEDETAEFIAHARQDIPDLLDAIEAANQRIAELEGRCDLYREHALAAVFECYACETCNTCNGLGRLCDEHEGIIVDGCDCIGEPD